ncbi:MAG: neutral/alkaline non-lysosomal ceramidase N-terminal domain-containing protein [Defluviitaleaceae bacterium]|nr:neutral/alkaline non-lysosomal ceramidase N-terminal domain-containing protein [Defluviitaleaceae bacterium]
MDKVTVGYSIGVITPKLGLGMAGYATDNRLSTAVHDDLHTRVLLIEKSGDSYLIVQNDLIGIDYAFSERVKDIAYKCGIKNKDNVFVGVTHTHSGPKGTMQSTMGMNEEGASRMRGAYDSQMCEKIFAVIEKSILEAVESKSPSSINYNFTEVEGAGENRNDKALPCDKTLLAMEFIREDGKKLLLYNFSCHPTVLHITNTEYTADWPYGVVKSAEGKKYEMVMFLNGSAGDVSTRFTRSAPSFEEAERIGKLVYSHIEKALEDAAGEEITSLKSLDLTQKMMLRPFGTIEEEEQKLIKYKKEVEDAKSRGETSLRLYESRAEGAFLNLARAKSFAGEKDVTIRIQALKLNDFVFIFLPGELFSALSLPVRRELGKKVVFCTYFTGTHGYICDTVAYDNETYEAMCSPFERGEGERLMEKAKEIAVSM